MAHLNKVRVIRADNSNDLEDRVNAFLEESSTLPGFCCMNLCYQVTSVTDPRKNSLSINYMIMKYSVMIHYVVNDNIKEDTEKALKGM